MIVEAKKRKTKVYMHRVMDEAVKLYNAGKNQTEVAEKVGSSSSMIGKHWKDIEVLAEKARVEKKANKGSIDWKAKYLALVAQMADKGYL